MVFELTEKQMKQIEKWKEDLEKRLIEKNPKLDRFGTGNVYYGAIGGGYTYCFTPTGLGDIVKIKECYSKEELDITDYDAW